MIKVIVYRIPLSLTPFVENHELRFVRGRARTITARPLTHHSSVFRYVGEVFATFQTGSSPLRPGECAQLTRWQVEVALQTMPDRNLVTSLQNILQTSENPRKTELQTSENQFSSNFQHVPRSKKSHSSSICSLGTSVPVRVL